jgi:plasmid stability protein
VVHSKQVADELLAALKAALCAKIDQRAMEVGDAQIKGSVYLSSEYQRNASEAAAWASSGFKGTAPAAILVGAESHGVTAEAEAEAILRESAMAEGLIETLRAWRMNAKGLNGIQGALTVDAAQAVFDAAIFDLEKAIGRGK